RRDHPDLGHHHRPHRPHPHRTHRHHPRRRLRAVGRPDSQRQ
ncbi:hypothetical protein Misp04_48520, partial [Micromonospora sp. NBRC 101691]